VTGKDEIGDPFHSWRSGTLTSKRLEETAALEHEQSDLRLLAQVEVLSRAFAGSSPATHRRGPGDGTGGVGIASDTWLAARATLGALLPLFYRRSTQSGARIEKTKHSSRESVGEGQPWLPEAKPGGVSVKAAVLHGVRAAVFCRRVRRSSDDPRGEATPGCSSLVACRDGTSRAQRDFSRRAVSDGAGSRPAAFRWWGRVGRRFATPTATSANVSPGCGCRPHGEMAEAPVDSGKRALHPACRREWIPGRWGSSPRHLAGDRGQPWIAAQPRGERVQEAGGENVIVLGGERGRLGR